MWKLPTNCGGNGYGDHGLTGITPVGFKMKTTVLCHSDDGKSRIVHPMQHIIHVRREGVNRYREQLACDLCHATWWIEYPHLKSLPNEMDTLWQDEGGEG